jgi:hypothetical protein
MLFKAANIFQVQLKIPGKKGSVILHLVDMQEFLLIKSIVFIFITMSANHNKWQNN